MDFLSLPLADPTGKTPLNGDSAPDAPSGLVAALTEFDAVMEGMTAIPSLAIGEQGDPALLLQDGDLLDIAQPDIASLNFAQAQTPPIQNPAPRELTPLSVLGTPDANPSAPQKTETSRATGPAEFQTTLTPQTTLPNQAGPASQANDPVGSNNRPIDLGAGQPAAIAATGAVATTTQDQGRETPIEPGMPTGPAALLQSADSRTEPTLGSGYVVPNAAKVSAPDAASVAQPGTYARPNPPPYPSAQPLPSDPGLPAKDPASPPPRAQETDAAKASAPPTAPTALTPQPTEATAKNNAALAPVATQSATAPMPALPGGVGVVETTGDQNVDIALPVKPSTTTDPGGSLSAPNDRPAYQPPQKAAEQSSGERPTLVALASNAGPAPPPQNGQSFAPTPLQGTPVAAPAYNMIAPPATGSQMAVKVTQIRPMPAPQDKAPDRATAAPPSPATAAQNPLSGGQAPSLASTPPQPLAFTRASTDQAIALGTETTGLLREASFGTVSGAPTPPGAAPSPMTPNPVHLPPQVMAQLAEMAPELRSGPVEIQLSPEELGRVRLSLVTTDTSVQIQIAADRPETQDLIRRHIDLLANDLREQGFTDVSFSFGTESGGHNAPQDDPAQSDTFDADLTSQVADTARHTLTIAPSARLDIRL